METSSVKNNLVFLIFFVMIGLANIIAQENYTVFDMEKDSIIIYYERTSHQIDSKFFNEEKYIVIDTINHKGLNQDSIIKYEKLLYISRNKIQGLDKEKKSSKIILVYNANTILPCVYVLEPIAKNKYKRTMLPLPTSIE
jgi:hypothetical protein